MSMMNNALYYAKRGWYVFPCREVPGASFERNGETVVPKEKSPYTAKGLLDATTDEDQIRAWWTTFPDALIGVNAGLSGLFVVDIDKKNVNGYDTYTSWDINDSSALISLTPSGGSHVVFTGKGKTNTNANTGIDTRGDGGYFIAPPSRIVEGKYTGEYKTLNDWSRVPGEIPDGLMSKLFPESTTEYVRGSSSNLPEGKRALSRATMNFIVNGAPEGERNSSLFKTLADFAGCGYTIEEARETVLPASQRSGLSNGEFETVLEHAYSKPRTSSIPDDIQEKILLGDKSVVSSINKEQQTIIEAVVLACMIVDNSRIDSVMDILTHSDFQSIAHKVVYRSIVRLHNKGFKADIVTVSDDVQKESDKISISGIETLANEFYVNPEHVTSYAQVIKEKSALRRVESVMDNKAKYMKGSLANVIAGIEKELSTIAVEGGVKSSSVLDGVQATEMVIERTRKISSGEITQLKTGFSLYDKTIGGVFSDELVLLTGKTGDGKSALSLSIANHVAMVDKKQVLFFTLEMSTYETVCRLVTQMTGIPYNKIYLGKLDAKEWNLYDETMKQIASSGLHFDDSFGLTPVEIRAKIRKLQDSLGSEGKELSLVIIDQLEMMKGYSNQPKYIQLDNISYDTKDFTKEFGVPIILNHQLKVRGDKNKSKNSSPDLADINQAGEKASNQVWAVSHQRDDNKEIMRSKVSVIKNRNGAVMEFPVQFIGKRMLFANPARPDEIAFTSGNNDDDNPHWVDD